MSFRRAARSAWEWEDVKRSNRLSFAAPETAMRTEVKGGGGIAVKRDEDWLVVECLEFAVEAVSE